MIDLDIPLNGGFSNLDGQHRPPPAYHIENAVLGKPCRDVPNQAGLRQVLGFFKTVQLHS